MFHLLPCFTALCKTSRVFHACDLWTNPRLLICVSCCSFLVIQLFFFFFAYSAFSVRHTLEGLALSKLLLVPSASVCMQAAVLFVLSSSLSPLVLRLQPGGSSGLHHGSGAVSSESSRPGMCQQRLHSIQGSGSLHCSWTQSAPLSTPGECHCKLLLSGPAIQGSSIGFRVYAGADLKLAT